MIIDIIKECPHRHPNSVEESDYIDQLLCYPVYEIIGKIFSPETFLEIGTLLGGSIISVVHGSQNVKEVAFIDTEGYIAGSNDLAKDNIKYYVSKYYKRPLCCDSYKSIEAFGSINHTQFDLMHIDGDHSYDGAMKDLEFMLRIRPKHVVVDDIIYIPAVFDAVKDFVKKRNLYWFGIRSFRGTAYINVDENKTKEALKLFIENGLECFGGIVEAT